MSTKKGLIGILTGGGDVPIRLWQRARRAGLALEVHGLDASATAIEHARANACRAGAAVESFNAMNVVEEVSVAPRKVVASDLLHVGRGASSPKPFGRSAGGHPGRTIGLGPLIGR